MIIVNEIKMLSSVAQHSGFVLVTGFPKYEYLTDEVSQRKVS